MFSDSVVNKCDIDVGDAFFLDKTDQTVMASELCDPVITYETDKAASCNKLIEDDVVRL